MAPPKVNTCGKCGRTEVAITNGVHSFMKLLELTWREMVLCDSCCGVLEDMLLENGFLQPEVTTKQTGWVQRAVMYVSKRVIPKDEDPREVQLTLIPSRADDEGALNRTFHRGMGVQIGAIGPVGEGIFGKPMETEYMVTVIVTPVDA